MNHHHLQEDRNGELLQAARCGEWEDLQKALDEGAFVDCRNMNEETPLHCACRRRRLDMAKLLAKHGADCNAKNIYGWTPLHFACWRQFMEVVEWLILEERADVNVLSETGGTPLLVASYHGNMEMVRLLLAAGVNILAENRFCKSCLYFANERGNNTELSQMLANTIQIVKLCQSTRTPADLNDVDSSCWEKIFVHVYIPGKQEFLFDYLCKSENYQAVATLVHQGADVLHHPKALSCQRGDDNVDDDDHRIPHWHVGFLQYLQSRNVQV